MKIQVFLGIIAKNSTKKHKVFHIFLDKSAEIHFYSLTFTHFFNIILNVPPNNIKKEITVMFKSLKVFRNLMEDIIICFAMFAFLIIHMYQVDLMVYLSVVMIVCFTLVYVIVNKFIRYKTKVQRMVM